MSTEELGYILKMPVPCPHCLQESEQAVAFLINNENFSCPECGGMVDLLVRNGLRSGKSSQRLSRRSSQTLRSEAKDDASFQSLSD
jgi:transcription initiation factor IIE alpha subunit